MGADYNAAADFVDRHVLQGRGDKAACIDPSRNITYAQLLDEAARVGPMPARLGVERENRVALVMLDSVDFPVVFWGAIRAGKVSGIWVSPFEVEAGSRRHADGTLKMASLFAANAADQCRDPRACRSVFGGRAGNDFDRS